MQTIKIGDLYFDVHDGPIGVSMSGGADSSILFYILLKYASGPIHVFSCGNGKTNYQEPIGAMRVINRSMQLLDRTDVTMHVHWKKHKLMHNMFDLEEMKRANINILYSGFTLPPPVGDITDYDTKAAFVPDDIPRVNRSQYYEDHNGKIYLPFANIDKKGVAKLYKELDVEDLYSYTRSCENLTLTAGHCGKCWWCKERFWAFGKLE
jgi:7-cyano-7-deazaguanine synthase in queuosine biosynthesis